MFAGMFRPFLAVLFCLAMPAHAEVTGKVRVIDGDTFAIGETRVRLHGIDTPESTQMCGARGVSPWPCGAWVSDKVRSVYDGADARCAEVDIDRYGRVVAKCFVGGEDVGQHLVAEGLALAYAKYSQDYLPDESSARDAGRGLHGMAFERPARFRAVQRDARAKTAALGQEVPEGCRIKGNISSSGGTMIYHVPGQRDYDATVISEARGERWFCSEDEARKAGWRRARR